ncbi:Alpha/Beta hydrolase protein [Truncatella angustata]|uniref:Alpha/Beta hydrolase protein n=1 Tax=Truncatella angustata TaxID=152316 RepID=A0A9P8UHV0_9PEZI|nr:Alpha/Beta hydrolase protein [Truncatella angustata]KAH6652465.1 Alpha/Beta hydrolase protein [Truncatella angustata]
MQLFGAIPYPQGMKESTHTITSLDGSSIAVRRLLPVSAGTQPGAQRAAVWAFGGGFFSGSVDVCVRVAAELAEMSQTQIFAVDYRLAPENPFPKAVEDMYATIVWLQANASSFNVDPSRIVVVGQSAGGGLAAGTALMARDKGLEPPLAGQILKYPMLDDRTTIDESSPLWKHLSWTVEFNDMAWNAYLGAERNDENVSPYAAPARVRDVSRLPRTFIDAGGLDLFRDENVAYAARLAAANVDVEFHLYPGVPHGYDGMAMQIRVTKEANANLSRFLSRV